MNPIRRDVYLPLARVATDLGELNATMEAAWTNHLAAKRLIERFRALKPREVCKDCGGVGMKVSISLGTPVPCAACRPDAFAEFFAALAYEYDVIRPIVAEDGGYGEELCVPPTLRSGEVGPWDLPADELNETAALPREVPAYWGKDRGDWDEHDNGSDISPKTRTEKA